ncbi:macrolide ABC transporter ATP-binding protein [candidate division WWE3 bacterium RIFOXYB1_FULL_43_24]|nr:MAG: macrolide ABC transporter ATP-binding protein [candidate division WWE3 bacterium RIFOXYA1_FULL_42_9]OGC69182.1 MAG: macrolide ABC transporter ATP-binding protein [candidate division WWE3 bacterium RIFOXYB1_FULL_43_24]OGC73256.1 MAG: macrolide ABC transporter ATP-binding protein [candidate division WWE3 bacterium RIFOXYC1_FULL_42_13]
MTPLQSPNSSIIKIKDIKRSFRLGTQTIDVLKGISLDIKKGEFVALMGPSGSGKSTLLNILGLLDVPTSGSYMLDEENVEKLSSDNLADIRNKKLGFIFQSFNLIPKVSALDNVVLPSIFYVKEETDKAVQLLTKLGLEDRLDHLPNELSGGQKQKVAIARSLINSPEILFADEPTGNLDSKSGDEVLEIILNLNKKDGKTIVMVTHDDSISAMADRVVHIKDGYLVNGL